MTHLERMWPAQLPPIDFADRVVSAVLREDDATGPVCLPPIALAQAPRRGKLGRWAGWALGAAMAMGCMGWYFGRLRPLEEARRRAELDERLEREAERARRARELAALQARVSVLQAELASAKAETLEARARGAETKTVLGEESKRDVASAQRGGGLHGTASCQCHPGDPLCSCL